MPNVEGDKQPNLTEPSNPTWRKNHTAEEETAWRQHELGGGTMGDNRQLEA